MTILTQPWLALRPSYRAGGVTVRPIQHGDAHLIDEMHQRLSPDSLYFRYLQCRPPTAAEIAAVCRLAPESGAGLVVTTQEAPTAIVGVAYYVREPHAAEPTAELGILIEDRFQGQGIGRRLWQRLQQQAQRDGVRRLRLLAHPQNQRMAWLVQSSGLPYAAKADGGLREYLVTNQAP
jgi:RimJ/RimL family protein N-acetyltransferase